MDQALQEHTKQTEMMEISNKKQVSKNVFYIIGTCLQMCVCIDGNTTESY